LTRYRKKPVVIEAIYYDGVNHKEISRFMQEKIPDHDADMGEAILINTLEGTLAAMPGDFIIKGVAGEFYPCKSNIFAATYERVDE
jgi:hypothetical protein